MRMNRRALEDGIMQLLTRCDFRLLSLLYGWLKYILGEED